jgi:hypothetical protein
MDQSDAPFRTNGVTWDEMGNKDIFWDYMWISEIQPMGCGIL